ncbi:MAG TPA: OstA family protein, partial [Oceanithermus sp.]|nr:OstA family protein [Oceanithermus sp.]
KGRKLSAGTLLHDVNKHRVRLFGKPFELPERDFEPKRR